ncbi:MULTISPECIES: UDP-glucose dehydrogenase family protein [Bacillaceae]|uniref:UDP-glucose 6-dehydrogenase n=1 Tax=Alkalicoccobacillus plakortidis TaxID=444060 RepID=A0A9D5I0P7_9BACI|nr:MULTISPECIES: UDP-glucose/GDP-mannose dehydrogenase family protein [Bacillaceae]KQL57353.1 UDP-glucose 6-dehydrogenase [Alkalicoccobacillus plakortidis]
MNVCVIGTGYVGLVTGVCFSSLGHNVVCVDHDLNKINSLRNGVVPIYEPGLKELMTKSTKAKKLVFTNDLEEGMNEATILLIAVGTPANKDGSANLTYIKQVALEIGQYIKPGMTIVTKSTVPVGTNKKIKQWVSFSSGHQQFSIASCPEFLREGNAIKDTLEMERAVFGVEDAQAELALRALHKPIRPTIVVTTIETAETAKYAANAFLATKISFINEVANVCENVGADVEALAQVMGLDHRIGTSFLQAGVGYGGSCFPKDTQAFIRIAEEANYSLQIVPAVERVNHEQRYRLLTKLKKCYHTLAGKRIAILGLAFKPHTDDMRAAPALDIIQTLLNEQSSAIAYDPIASEQAKRLLPDVILASSWQEAVRKADAVLILTDWNEFKTIDLEELKVLMRDSVVIDGRNVFNPEEMKQRGFYYDSIGRTQVDGRASKQKARPPSFTVQTGTH